MFLQVIVCSPSFFSLTQMKVFDLAKALWLPTGMQVSPTLLKYEGMHFSLLCHEKASLITVVSLNWS